MDLDTLKAEVKHLLESSPETRDSNAKLYGSYLARHGITTISVAWFYSHFNSYGVSDFESVTRCRRKIVEEHPELGPSDKVKDMRHEKQVDIYDFMKGNR